MDHRNVKTEVIDVDAFHSRYDDPDGFVQPSSADEFRKTWRTLYKERDRSQNPVAGRSESPRQGRDFSSTLGLSIRKALSHKRAQPAESTVDSSNPSKRPKTNAGPPRLTDRADYSLPGDEWPSSPFAGSGSNHLQAPPSPDLVIVDQRRREQRPFPTVSAAVKPLKRRSPSPIHWRQDDDQLIKKTTRQTEKSKIEVIEVFSDHENEHPHMEYTQELCHMPRRSNSPIEFLSDSEHSDDWDPPGFDLNDSYLWLPIPNNVNKEEGVLHSIEKLAIHSPPPLRRYRRQDTSRWSPPPPPPRQPLYVWDKLQLAENLRWKPKPRPVLMQPQKVITRLKDLDFNLHKLNIVASFKQAPGTINAIEQFEGLTLIGSACDGGLADVFDERPSPYNRTGSLSVWSDGRAIILHEHMRRGNPPKYYTINDIKFEPTRKNFVSIGEDKRCRVWGLNEEPDEPEWRVTATFLYHSVPHGLAFRPGSSILAVAEKRLLVYDLQDEGVVGSPCSFTLHHKGSAHTIGSIAWGRELTADHLFASSEPTKRTFTGAHKAFDFRAQKPIYQFDAEDAGDVIAIDEVGETLGLCTQAEANRHTLRLYDIRRRDSKAFASLDMLPFSSHETDRPEGEMNVATFSPDQLYLAIARNDNYTHVYDRRMLGKYGSEPLFEYCHDGELKTVSKHESYGIVQAKWLQSSWTRRTCLVTGGEDGCIRMWDPSIAADNVQNGSVLAEVNCDISQFSIGDPFVGEHRLVVGDSSGSVTIFDHICA